MKKVTKNIKAFTLIEILVVTLIFTIIGIIATQTLILSIRGTRKSESLVRVKQSVEYSLSFMERALRSAKELTGCTPNSRLDFIDYNDQPAYFYCDGTSQSISTTYLTPSLNRITSPDVHITNCTTMFNCDTTSTPHSVEITIQASDATVTGAEGAQIDSSTSILLRNY